MLPYWKRIRGCGRSVLNLALTALLLLMPGAGGGQLLRDGARLSGPVVDRGASNAVAVLRLAVPLGSAAALLVSGDASPAFATSSGAPWAWGNNVAGQLGDNFAENWRLTPG